MRILALIALAFLIIPADDPITEVTFTRSACRGHCPSDSVVLRSDGTAEYNGSGNVARIGKYKGKIEGDQFEKLAKLLVEKRFFEMKDGYDLRVWDTSWLTTTARRGKTTKKVVDYGIDRAPKELVEIDRKILEVTGKIEWTKAD